MFLQANYGAAKMALVGLTKTLALEGKKHNIHVNALAPLASMRDTRRLALSPSPSSQALASFKKSVKRRSALRRNCHDGVGASCAFAFCPQTRARGSRGVVLVSRHLLGKRTSKKQSGSAEEAQAFLLADISLASGLSSVQVFEAGAGWVSAVRFQRSAGCAFSPPLSLEAVSSRWSSVVDFTKDAHCPASLHDAIARVSEAQRTALFESCTGS